jgi:hypothetical protein
MRKKWPITIAAIIITITIFILILRIYNLGPFFQQTEIIAGDWEFATFAGGKFYNETVFGRLSLTFDVNATIDSQVYMLSQQSKNLPVTSISTIRSSTTNCLIDWGWLGTHNNYAFLTWNGTHWIADTNNGSNTPEKTTIDNYYPSTDWRKLTILVNATQVTYYIDDQLVATHTTRIPSGEFEFYGELTSIGNAAKLWIRSHNY